MSEVNQSDPSLNIDVRYVETTVFWEQLHQHKPISYPPAKVVEKPSQIRVESEK